MIEKNENLARSLMEWGEYEEARTLLVELMEETDDPAVIRSITDLLHQCVDKLIEQKEAILIEDPTNDENAFQLAVCYIQNKRPKDTIRICQLLSPSIKESYRFAALLGRAYYLSGNYEDALEYLCEANDTRTNEQSGIEYANQYAISKSLFRLDRDDEAFSELKKLWESGQADASVYLLSAWIMIRNRSYKNAHELLDTLKEHSDGDFIESLWGDTLLAYYEEDDDAKTLDLCRKMHARIDTGEYFEWEYELILLEFWIHWAKKNHFAALAALDRIIYDAEDLQIIPSIKVYNSKIQLHKTLNQVQDAIDTIYEAENLFGNVKPWVADRFEAYFLAGEYEKAMEMLDQWDASDPDDSDADHAIRHYHRVSLCITMDRIEQAEQTFAKYKDVMFENQRFYAEMYIAGYRGNDDHIIQMLHEKLDKAVDGSDIFSLAMHCALASDMENARKYAEKAIRLMEIEREHPTMNACMIAMGHAILGEYEAAQKGFEQVKTMMPCSFCNYRRCKDVEEFEAMIYELKGDLETALQKYEEGMKNWPNEVDYQIGRQRLCRKMAGKKY